MCLRPAVGRSIEIVGLISCQALQRTTPEDSENKGTHDMICFMPIPQNSPFLDEEEARR